MPRPLSNASTWAGAICCATLLNALSGSAAAGGHFAIDDAALLDAGQCQVDAWFEAEARADRSLFHAGPSCGLGPVEVGLGWDRLRTDSADAATVTNVQVKWAVGITETLSVGAAAAAYWQAASPRYLGASLVIPVSWRISDSLQTHLNLGKDFLYGGPSPTRAGFAVEWQPISGWVLIAERFRQFEGTFGRAGLRWEPSKALSVELSLADRWGGRSSPWWAFGVAWAFDQRRRPANVDVPTAQQRDQMTPSLALKTGSLR